jgi:lipid II:glycine glycyltransferase (peptidoglycan interpeptide bridge formation enzyme)
MLENSPQNTVPLKQHSYVKPPTRYTFRPVRSSQRELWNTFVAHHANGHFLQCWEWGELKAGAGWHPLRLALWDGMKIVAGAQVLCKTVPGVPLWLGHHAYIPRGPVVDWSQDELCALFFAQLHLYLRQHGALALWVEPDAEEGTAQGEMVLRRLQEAGKRVRSVHPVQPLRTITLDLAPTEEQLLGGMKEKWRYNVRLGLRKGVTIRDASSLEDVRAWYNLLQTTGERDQFGIHDLAYYQKIWTLCVPRGTLRLLLAEHDGQLLAGIFVAVLGQQVLYLYGASSNERRQLMPNYVLQWEAMRWAKAQGAQMYDFWGIPDTDAEDEAMAGVYRFKRGWGGRVVRYPGCFEYAYFPCFSILRRIAERIKAQIIS